MIEVLEISEEQTETVCLSDEEVPVADAAYVRYRHEGGPAEWALALSGRALGRILGYSRPRDACRLIQRNRDALSNYLVSSKALRSQGAPPRQSDAPEKQRTYVDAQEANEDAEILVFGPGIDLAIMKSRGSRADEFREWLAKRSYELRTRGVTTVVGLPPTGASLSGSSTALPLEAMRHHLAAAGSVLSVLEQHEFQITEHGDRIAQNEKKVEVLSEVVKIDRRRRGGIRTCDRAVLASDFHKHGCTVCGKRSLGFQVGHVVAQARGGADSIDNLMPQCKGCNLNETAADRTLRTTKDESYAPDPRPANMVSRYRNLSEKLPPGQLRLWG